MERKFSYRKEGREYVFYRDDELIMIGDGIKVCTVNRELAEEMLEAIEKREHPGSVASILSHHFSTLLGRENEDAYSQEISQITYDSLLEDNYLMFRQVAPMRQIIAQHFFDNLPSRLASLPFHKKMATINLAQNCHSYMLAYYLLIDVIEHDNVDKCKEAFLEDLLEYYEDFFDTKEEAESFLNDITPVINTYVKYMSYDEV